jgi:hypothetical protein
MKKFLRSTKFETITFICVIIFSLVIILGSVFKVIPFEISSVIYCLMLAVLAFIFVVVPFLFSKSIVNRKLFYITMFVRIALCLALFINWFWHMENTIFGIISPIVLFCIVLIIITFLLGNKYDNKQEVISTDDALIQKRNNEIDQNNYVFNEKETFNINKPYKTNNGYNSAKTNDDYNLANTRESLNNSYAEPASYEIDDIDAQIEAIEKELRDNNNF